VNRYYEEFKAVGLDGATLSLGDGGPIFQGDEFLGFEGNAPHNAQFKLPRALTPDEMINLTREHGIEFQLAREIHYSTKKLGDYWLFTGFADPDGFGSVGMPLGIDEWDLIDIYHTHISPDKLIPSEGDLFNLTERARQ